MTTSGTYVFNPAASDVFGAAFSMLGIRRAQLTTEHVVDAAYHANMLLIDFSNRNPNMWSMETQPIALTANVATYDLSPRTIAIGAAYISITDGSEITDRLITPMSATEYAALSNKARTGFPNSYCFKLLSPTPTISLYFVPDTAHTYTLNLISFRQMQDLNPANDQTIDAPYRFLDAFTTGLASRLAVPYPDKERPTLAKDLDLLYKERVGLASAQDQEDVNLYIVPGMQGYFR